jgi:hypothetical protein
MTSRWTPARVRGAAVRRIRELRAATWALRAGVAARRQLETVGLEGIELPRVPALPRVAGRRIVPVLRRTRRTCLERALVRQRWLAAHGVPRDLVIGINAVRPFVAHAWLEGDPATESMGYEELSRHPPTR